VKKEFLHSKDQKVKQMAFTIWIKKFQNSKNETIKLCVAVRWRRVRIIQKILACLKLKAEANCAMQHATDYMSSKTKTSAFLAWRSIAQQTKNLAILMRKIMADKKA
jgi:hypothetical protein